MPYIDLLKHLNKKVESMQKIRLNGTEEYFLYESLCDGIPTLYLTKSKWNFHLTLKFEGGEIVYKDDNNDEVLIYEEGDEQYKSLMDRPPFIA